MDSSFTPNLEAGDYGDNSESRVIWDEFDGHRILFRGSAPTEQLLQALIAGAPVGFDGVECGAQPSLAVLLVHPQRYMTPVLEEVLQACTDRVGVHFVGSGASKQNAKFQDRRGRPVELAGVGRTESIRRLLREYTDVAVFAGGDEDTALAVDRLLGTQFSLDHLRSVGGLTEAVTVNEAYALVPGSGWALTSYIGDQERVIVLPEYQGVDVSALGSAAFAASRVEEVHVPPQVRSVGPRAFADCANLSLVTLAPGLRNIMEEAFAETALAAVDLPSGLQTVGPRAFSGCPNLRCVRIPSSVHTIGRGAFDDCSDGLHVIVEHGSFAHYWANRSGVRHTVEPVAPPSERLIVHGDFKFRRIGETQLELESVARQARRRRTLVVPAKVNGMNVVGIGRRAFRGMKRLEALTLPSSIRWIRAGALADSPKLTPPAASDMANIYHISESAMPRVDLRALRPTPQHSDSRSAQMTPRSLSAYLPDLQKTRVPRSMLDQPLTRIVHIPSQVVPGAAFFYWHDDNDFHEAPAPQADVSDAARRGASLLISSERVKLEDGSELPTLIHPRPRDLFRKVNALIRQQYVPRTITITGSIGKTTTKQMLELVVEDSFRAKVSEGNNNNVNFTGRVFSTIDRSHEVYIQETGASYFGQVQALNEIARPDALVITNIGTNHLAGYGESREELLRDKLSPDKLLPDGGVVFLNWDDPLLRGASVLHEVVSFSVESPDARYQAIDLWEGPNRLRFTIVDHATAEATPVELSVVGRHNAYSALAAFAVGRWLGLEAPEIAMNLSGFRPQFMRQALLDMEGQQVLVDCYNASEASVVSSAESLSQMATSADGRRVFVFGDLTNRGSQSEVLHRQIGRDLASSSPLDLLVCYGKDSAFTAEEANNGGLDVFHTESLDELVRYLKENSGSGDAIAFKASRRMRLEQAVDALYGTTLALGRSGMRVVSKTESRVTEGLELKHIPGRGFGVSKLADTELVVLDVPGTFDGVPVDVLLPDSFMGTDIEVVRMVNPLRTIGANAFRQCRKLVSVDLPSSVRTIDTAAFSACSSLEDLRIPEGVRHIGRRAFRYCRNLRLLTLPGSVSHLGDDLFVGTASVTVRCVENSYAHKFMQREWPDIALEVV